MLRIFGTPISNRAVRESLVHTAIETVGGIVWLTLAVNGILNNNLAMQVAAGAVWLVTLTVEHIVALAPGKDA